MPELSTPPLGGYTDDVGKKYGREATLHFVRSLRFALPSLA
jgi:hypothetical protein